MYRKSFLFFIFGLLLVSPVFGDSCKYTSKIEQCKNAALFGRTITDFVCVSGGDEKIIYQIVLDDKFKKIDKEMDRYLTSLEQNKDYYFGVGASKNFIEGVNDMFRQFGEYGYFWTEFKNACSGEIIEESIACMEDESTSISHAKNYIQSRGNTCMNLANQKLEISKQVALNVLNLNKYQVRKDQMKLYVQEERKKYNDLLDMMMANLGYMERILHKWPYKLKTVKK